MSFYYHNQKTAIKFKSSSISRLFRKAPVRVKSKRAIMKWNSSVDLNMKKIMKTMSNQALKSKKERIAQGITGSGKRVPDYSDSYKKRKSSIGKSGVRNTMRYSGVLLASLHAEKSIIYDNGIASTQISLPRHQRQKKNFLGAKGYYIYGVTMKTRREVERAVKQVANKILIKHGKSKTLIKK